MPGLTGLSGLSGLSGLMRGLLPYTLDFSTLGDGALPAIWTGPTWAISGGLALNTPTLDGELLTDPGLEAPYVGGKCNTIVITSGAPTLADGAPDVHGGSHAQQMANNAAGDSIKWPNVTPTAGMWYVGSLWDKRTGGAGNGPLFQLAQPGTGLPAAYMQRNSRDAAWTQVRQAIVAGSAAAMVNIMVQYGAGQTVIYDDGSMKAVAAPTHFAFLSSDVSADVVIKLAISSYDMLSGIVFRANDRANPTDYHVALMWNDQPSYVNTCRVAMLRFVAGVPAVVIAATTVTFVADADLEVRCSGDQLELWYDSVQVDGTKTDANGQVNRIHGMCSAGGSERFSRFFCGTKLTDYVFGYAGSSNTYNDTYGYRTLSMADLRHDYPQLNFTFLNTSQNGWAVWPNLIKLSDLATAQQVAFDNSNNEVADTPHFEAYIRKTWGNEARVAAVIFPEFAALTNDQVTIPTNETQILAYRVLYAAYGVPYVDFWQICLDLVPGTYNLNQLMADNYHATALGHSLIEAQLLPYLPRGGAAQPSPLPSRVYAASADFEQAPLVILGTDYDSRAGAGWADTGTRTESNNAGDTIVYSGTFRSFGCYRADAGTNDVEVDINGGGFNPIAFYQNGYDIGTRAVHTITIRIPIGGSVRIDEFWAI
jgi:hypothetical protein